MTIAPNRFHLKNISDFAIDAQFSQKYGMALFSYQGEDTEDYQNLRAHLLAAVSDAFEALTKIRDHLLDTRSPVTP